MNLTREKLIAAAIDLVTEAGGEELTVRRVAARAGVSVPTAYRHFPDREALLQGMARWINARIVGPSVPTTAEGVPAWVRHVFESFETHDRLVRAQLSTPAGRAIRARTQKARKAMLVALSKRALPSATAVTQYRLTALIHILVNLNAWVSLHDSWGLSGVEAGQAAAWAIETLLSEVHRHPTALDFESPGARAAPSPRGRRAPPRSTRPGAGPAPRKAR